MSGQAPNRKDRAKIVELKRAQKARDNQARRSKQIVASLKPSSAKAADLASASIARLTIENFKLQNEKLKVEISGLKKCPFLKPNALTGFVVALVALGGFGIQYSSLDFDLRQAKIDRDTAKSDIRKYREKLAEIQSNLAGAESNLRLATGLAAKVEASDTTTPHSEVIQVRGKVMAASNNSPMAGVMVSIRRNGKLIAAAATDSSGAFTLSLASGSALQLNFERPGFVSGVLKHLSGDRDQLLGLVMFERVRPGKSALGPNDQPVSHSTIATE